MEMAQGGCGLVPADECWDDDLELPIVDPSTMLTLGSKGEQGGARLTTTDMNTIAEMRMYRDQWVKIISSLQDREGTLLDITADMMAYEDQDALRDVRFKPLDVRTSHMFSALSGTATWPTVLAVESWLRDCMMTTVIGRHDVNAAMLWCIVVARAVGEEGIRDVARRMNEWYSFDVKEAMCSRGGTDATATIAMNTARMYKEFLWLKVLEQVESCSVEAFWDWRRADYGCMRHGCGKCPNAGKQRLEYVIRCGCECS